MAGRGPAPKPAASRARRNAPPTADRVLTVVPTDQPGLPEVWMADEHGERAEFIWPERTRAWWAMWADSPLAAEFTTTDWSELLDTALLHAEFWTGNLKVAGELRLRVAKFGATPEDRARLRITFAVADEAETKAAKRRSEPKPKVAATEDPRLRLA